MGELPILPVDRIHPVRAMCMELESGSGLSRSGSWQKDGKRKGNGVCVCVFVCVCVCVSDVRAIPPAALMGNTCLAMP